MAKTQSIQVKVTLPEETYLLVKNNASRLGLNPASYLRHLVINDSWDKRLPVFKMTQKQEKVLEKALEDHKNGKTIRIDNIDQFFDNLKSKWS